jgi:hypothetical protein
MRFCASLLAEIHPIPQKICREGVAVLIKIVQILELIRKYEEIRHRNYNFHPDIERCC